MKTETHDFLLVPGYSALCLANAIEPLRAANTLGGREAFRWRLLSLDGGPVASSSNMRMDVDARLGGVPPGDVLYVVSSYDFTDAVTPAFKVQLARAAERTPVLGGLDTGAWLLATLGLLEGRRATIHWQERTRLEEDFPDVDVSAERYVVDGNRITAGGATTVLDLMLSVIRTRFGNALAVDVMRLFLYDAERAGDAPQQGTLSADFIARHPQAAEAISVMEASLETPLPISDVAGHAGCSQRVLERLFQRLFGLTPKAYYTALRLEEAKRLIEGSGMSMAEVAARTGFSSLPAFSRAFKNHFGVSPRRARRS